MASSPRSVFSRDVRLLFASLFLANLPLGYLQVVLPLYLNRVGLDPALIGLLYTVSGLVTAALVALSGVLADRFSRRWFVIWGTALPILSYLVFALSTAPGWLLVASTLGGVGLAGGAAGAMTAAAFDALLAEHTPPRHRTQVFAWSQAIWDLALAVGSLGAGLPEWIRAALPAMGELEAYRPPFFGLIVLAAVATLLALPVRDHQEVAHQRASGRSWLPRRSRGPIARYAFAVGLLGLGLGTAVQLMPLWFRLRFGTDEAALGPWYAASGTLSILALVLAPWLERRAGGARLVMAAQVSGAACLLLVALSGSYEQAAALFLARNVLTNLSWPVQQALLMAAVPPEERATAAGIGFSVWGITNSLGPALGGVLLSTGSLWLPLVVAASAYACAGIVFGLGFRPAAGTVPATKPETASSG